MNLFVVVYDYFIVFCVGVCIFCLGSFYSINVTDFVLLFCECVLNS